MKNCRILGSKYWTKIYKTVNSVLPFLNYPVKENVLTPLPYVDQILEWDILVLDNTFPWRYWEEALWDRFLELYLAQWIKAKIICISDFWHMITEKHKFRNEAQKRWDIIWRFSKKDAKWIANFLKEYVKTLETY